MRASLVLPLGLMLAGSACTSVQIATAQRDVAAAQRDIAALCAMAVPLSPLVPEIGIYVQAACVTDAVIARLAENPTTVAWLTNLCNKLLARKRMMESQL